MEFHPASGKPPEICDFTHEDLSFPVTPTHLLSEGPPAWYPFASRTDFEQAEIFVRFDATDAHINAQLRLMNSTIGLNSATEVHNLLAEIPALESIEQVNLLVTDSKLIC